MKADGLSVISFFLLAFIVCKVQAIGTEPIQDPITGELVWEEETEVPSWSITIILHRHAHEGTDYILGDLQIREKSGARRTLAKDIIGPIVVFEEHKIVASCEGGGSISQGPAPIFVSLDGSRKIGPKHLPEYIRRCERIPNSALLLIQYGLAERNFKPYNIIRIVSTTGETVLEKRMDHAGQLEVQYQGKEHNIQIQEPEYPG